MKLVESSDFLKIVREIQSARKSAEEWAAIESDDMFQEGPFVGGFDADEGEFCFSYYSPSDEEWWFQVSVDQVARLAEGGDIDVEMRPAE